MSSYADLEQRALESVPAWIQHVPDAETQDFDGRVVADFTDDGSLLIGLTELPSTTPVEIKTCVRRMADGDRGRWRITKRAHRRLKRNAGVYLLAIREGDQILEKALVDVLHVDRLLNGWTTRGADPSRDAEATISWGRVFDDEEIGGEGSA